MPRKKEMATAGLTFEQLKLVNEHGAEYWSARDLQPLLGYTQWRRFEQAIDRAITSCNQSGNPPEHHFAGAGKMIELGKGGLREVEDYHLSRFACDVILRPGYPRKPESFGSASPITGLRAHIVHRAMGIDLTGQER